MVVVILLARLLGDFLKKRSADIPSYGETTAVRSANWIAALQREDLLGAKTDPAGITSSGTIIPGRPSAPATANWTAVVTVRDQDYILAAGTYLYSTQDRAMIMGDGYNFAKLVNNGTLWMDGRLGPNLTANVEQYSLAIGVDVINNGVAVALAHDDSPRVGESDAIPFYNFYNLTNSGQIFAWAEVGRALALLSYNVPTITNSGLIAASADTGLATAIDLQNGGAVFNQAGGRILAEAPVAVAVLYYNAGLPSGGGNVQVTNAGLIQAASTNANVASIALSFAHISYQTVRVVNSGTITADIAIVDQTATEGNYSPVQASAQLISNLAGGVINGDIILDRGDDAIDNSGIIRGDILLGEGNDRLDTTNGSVTGRIDLNWGDDVFKGSADADFVAGADGNDSLTGNGGNDQLMGGGNNDTLIGGAGNDGLFGEYGDDLIITQGGDFVWAGPGNDRIELGDFAFEHVSGNEGFDVLVLPAGPRMLDLSIVLASGALDGIERIVLGGNKEIVVRAADIPAVTGSHELQLDGGTSDTIDLIGAWAAEASVVIDGTSYRQFSLAGEVVLVSGQANVEIRETGPSGAAGLDPIPVGGLAPIPGDGRLDFTPSEFYLTGYVLTQSTTVNPEETWWNDLGAAVLNSSSYSATITLTNYGHIETHGNQGTVGGALELSYVGLLDNYGTISASWTWDNPSHFAEMKLGGYTGTARGTHILNHGTIEASAVHGGAVAVYFPDRVTNIDLIHASSEFGWATGIWGNPYQVTNEGSVIVEAPLSAIGAELRNNMFVNDGLIQATSGTAGVSIGILIDGTYGDGIVNNGWIIAKVAIQAGSDVSPAYSAITVTNNGTVVGNILGSLGDDHVANHGTIRGDIHLDDGTDFYDGRGAAFTGIVDGGAGNDILIGSAGVDALVGGSGNDVITGGGGQDHLTGGSGTDTFIFTTLSDSVTGAIRSDGAKFLSDIILDFKSGEDRIDLSQIDAISGTATNDAFTFVGGAAFSHHAGELRFEARDGYVHIYADVDGDGFADMHIVAAGPTIQASDFIL